MSEVMGLGAGLIMAACILTVWNRPEMDLVGAMLAIAGFAAVVLGAALP